MPAKSKAQQRLFGMVHAYNRGEFHGGRALRGRIAGLASRISDEDARHFAETPHAGLPERKEKKAGTPSDADLRRMYEVVQADARLFKRLKALGLVGAVRSGRAVRNRIVHQPGYVPSPADADRALRDYTAAERTAGGAEKRAGTPSDEDFRREYQLDTPWYAPWPSGAYDDSAPSGGPDVEPESGSEKQAQVMFRPDEVQRMYGMLEPRIEAMAMRVSDRSRKRRSFLQHVVRGTAKGALVGATVGGLGLGAVGAGMVKHLGDSMSPPPPDLGDRMIDAGAKFGLWGAGNGALVGSLTGLGIGVLNGIRE